MVRPVGITRFMMSALVAGLAAIACEGGASGGSAVVRSDSAEVQLVRNENPSDSATARLEESARIGLVDGAEEYQFDGITAIVADDADTLYVANGRTSSIRVFDPNGKFVREFGREGQGPGELESIGRIFLAGDTLVVSDALNTSIFRRSGEFIERWSRFGPDGTLISIVSRAPGGWLAFIGEEPDRKQMRQGVPFEIKSALHILDARQRRGPSLRSQPAGRLIIGAGGEIDWPLFEPRAGVAVTDDGTQLIADEVYRVDVYDSTGRHVRRVTRTHTPRPILSSELEAYKERIRQRYRDRPARRGAETAASVLRRVDAQEAGRVARHWGPLGRIVAARGGAFWIERTDLREDPWMREYEEMFGAAPDSTSRPGHWDRFDETGIFLGAIDLPPGFTPHALGERSVIGVLRDDLGVEYVVRYAVLGINETSQDDR